MRTFRLRTLLLALLLWAVALTPACSDDNGSDDSDASLTECQLHPQTCPDATVDGLSDGDDVSEDSSADEDVTADTLASDAAGEDADTSIEGDTTSADTLLADQGEDAAAEDLAEDASAAASLVATEAHEHEVLYGWIVAGQPSEARLAELIDEGAVILSLRTELEDPFDEPAYVASLGGTFVRYPVSSADYGTPAFREALYDLYDAHLDAGDLVYIHCASSNRAGASWALYQGERQGVPAEDAVAMGIAAGMSSLESMVRSILGV